MVYLLLNALSSVFIFVAFKAFDLYKVDTLQAIAVNYAACVLTGAAFVMAGENAEAIYDVPWSKGWFGVSLAVGAAFIVTFYLMARTTQLVGMSVASVAAKISMAVPVLANLLLFPQAGAEKFDLVKGVGIGFALAAVVLVTLKGKEKQAAERAVKLGPLQLLFPVFVFVNTGALDTTLNYANARLIPAEDEAVFPLYVFGVAFLLGSAYAAWEIRSGKRRFAWKNVWAGVALGVPNYFSIYFLLKALSAFDNAGALVYPALNILVILGSTAFSVGFFGERLYRSNALGILLAVAAIGLLFYRSIGQALGLL